MLCFLKSLLILFETKVIFDSVAYLIIVIFENDYFLSAEKEKFNRP